MAEYIERQAIMDVLLYEQYGYLCEDAIKRIPAADVAPVRHGRNESGGWFLCSVCNFGDFGGFHGYVPNFCPNCGARMDGET